MNMLTVVAHGPNCA